MSIINSVMVSRKKSLGKSKTDWIPFCRKKSLRTAFLTKFLNTGGYFRCTSPGFPPSADVDMLEVRDWTASCCPAAALPMKWPVRAAKKWPKLQQREDPDGNKLAEAQLQQDLHEYLPKEKQSGTQSGSEQNFHVVILLIISSDLHTGLRPRWKKNVKDNTMFYFHINPVNWLILLLQLSLYGTQVKRGKNIKNILLMEDEHISNLKAIYSISQVLLQSSRHS